MKLNNKCRGMVYNQHAITLIALIITIIVLLILAGVTINLTLRDNGLFEKLKEAQRMQKIAEETELIKLSYAGLDIDYRVFDIDIEAKKLEEEINHSKAAKVEEVENMPEDGMLVDNGVTEGILCKVTMEYEYYIYLPGVTLEAGLWKNGNLIYSWQQLKDMNMLSVDETGLAKLLGNPALYDGDLVIHQEVTKLYGYNGVNSNGYTNLSSIKTLGILNEIGAFAYSGLEKLDINFENGIINSFVGNSKLKEVNFKGTMNNIGSMAFNACNSLEEIIFDCTIEEVGQLSLASGSLKRIVFNKHVGVVKPCGYSENSTYWFVEEIVFNDGVDRIETTCFRNAKNLKTCTINGECSYISTMAFLGCSALTSFRIPNGIETIEEQTFYGCESIEEIYIPDSVTTIGHNAFLNAKKLKEINLPNNLTTIASGAFQNCETIEELVIPDSVTTIESVAFMYCKNLKSVILSKNLNTLGDQAFLGTAITSLNIPNGIDIGSLVFAGCSALTDVNINSNIGASMFNNCKNLQNVTIGDNVDTISSNAFYGCTGLTNLEIPNTVTAIGENAFKDVPHITYTGSAEGSPWGATLIN